jgi:ketosteroid isomerase-like protein
MHPNSAILQRLFTALDQHDHRTMGACYHPRKQLIFEDIAFSLRERKRILAMWHMICERTDIRAAFDILNADDREGRANLVDEYTFRDTGRKVRNAIDSRFRFEDGFIVEHRDYCDPAAWASMAFGGIKGFLAGHIRLLRSVAATKKLDAFISTHPEYR